MRSASMEIETALDHSAFVLEINHEVDQTAAEIVSGLDSSAEAQAEKRILANRLLRIIRELE